MTVPVPCGLLRMIPLEPPVTPDREEARRWAEEELSKPQYPAAQPTWLQQMWRDFLDWLNSLEFETGSGGNPAVPIMIAVAVVLIVVAVLAVRPRLNARKRPTATGLYGDDPAVDAAAYRRRALAAADDGDWPAAVVEQFRAVVRSAEERDIIEPRPGRTADEAAWQLGQVFGTVQERLDSAAGLFDAVRYGDQPAVRGDFDSLRRLDEDLAAMVPDFSEQDRHGFAVPR